MATIPKFQPQLAALVEAPPRGQKWLHELKFDGYRIACTANEGKVQLESRSGNDWTARFPELVAAVRLLPARSLLLDGEAVILLPNGLTSFQGLQNAFRRGSSREGLAYFVFDLLHLDGRNIAALPLEERKRELEKLTGALPKGSPIRYSQHFEVEGVELLSKACALGAEGIVSKRRDQSYKAGRNDGWQKSKCTKRETFVVGGFTEPSKSRSGIGALLVGKYEGTRLRYAGKVGTGVGFTDEYLRGLRRELDAIQQEACPFDPIPAGSIGKHGRWVRPVKTGEVAFTEWTNAGTLRHPSFQGFKV